MRYHPWTQRVIDLFTQNANLEKADPMAKYMKNHFQFLGLTSHIRTQLLSHLLQKENLPQYSDLFAVINELWSLPEREYQYAALTLLEKTQKQLSPAHIPQILELIPQKSWWDTVDALAGSILSKIVKKHPDSLYTHFQPLIQSNNFWENRTAIIVQLKCGPQTNTQFLTDAILPHRQNKEFFLRKAIGWALRQYARTNPNWVIDFVSENEHSLSGLSKREALKHITSF
ncbi:MAG: DNA alkylation repair protein [Bacteroidota bacterium]|jgi:3-methyladenine DNA glycosylase AlkD